MKSAPWSASPYPLYVGRAQSFTLGQFSQAMGQVARYDELLGQSYDQLDLGLIEQNFQWQDHATGELFDFFDEQAPQTDRTLQFKTAALPDIIDLTDQELHDFQHSNAKYYLRLQLIQILQQTPGPKHFTNDYYAYEKRLRRGARAEEFIATLPLIDKENVLGHVHLTFKTPIGSRFDNFLKTDLLNVVIRSEEDSEALRQLRRALQTLGEACALKYDFQNYRPVSFRRESSLLEPLLPPQSQQIDFLMWQTRCLQELVHVYLHTLLRVVLESLPVGRQENLHRNPYTLRPEEFASLIPENLARLLLVEDALQSQILKLTEKSIADNPVRFELLGIQVKSSRVGLEKHVRMHGTHTGVIRPPSLLVHNRFSPETPFYTQHLRRTIQAYADLQRLWHR